MADSLGPESFVFLVPPTAPDGQNPLVFLQAQQDAVAAELRRHIRDHQLALADGDDCGPIRAQLARDFVRLSETCVLLHEVCGREQAVVEGLVSDFEKWDRRRTRVLRHIQQIKSDSSKYGTKLAGLLRRRHEVDHEVETLELRIAALKAQRSTITREIGETSSVLESKSAKYVNVFRDLERKGRDVIAEYLGSAGVQPHDLELLLRSEPVDAGFSMAKSGETVYTDLPPLPGQGPGQGTGQGPGKGTGQGPTQSKFHGPSPAPMASAASMGIQPFEVPQSPLAYPHPPLSPYAQGYASGSQHLERLKQSLSGLMHGAIRQPHSVDKEKVDDILNTITEKIDLSPILHLLRHKIEALEDMSLKTSRLSAFYNNQGLAWADTCKLLDSQEKLILFLLSDPNIQPTQLVERLKATIEMLTRELDLAFEAYLASATSKENSLGTIIHHEIKAIAIAVDLLVGDNSTLQAVESLVTEDTAPKISGKHLSMRITAAGYHPSASPTTVTARVNSTPLQDSVFGNRSKNMKSE